MLEYNNEILSTINEVHGCHTGYKENFILENKNTKDTQRSMLVKRV